LIQRETPEARLGQAGAMEKINQRKKMMMSIPQSATIPIEISGWSFIH